ncbi:hypothetical protein ACFLQ6_09585 [Thermoproteota archaeon]
MSNPVNLKWDNSFDRATGKYGNEHCSINPNDVQGLCLINDGLGQQIRLETRSASGSRINCGLYTITDNTALSGDVLVGGDAMEDAAEKWVDESVTASWTDNFPVDYNPQVVHPTYTESQAEQNNEFIERVLTPKIIDPKLIAIAPHGGKIEEHTDWQAEELAKMFPKLRANSWCCKGWMQGVNGGAYDTWHITSVDINEDSFPKLYYLVWNINVGRVRSIIDYLLRTGRRRIIPELGIAFHGWTRDWRNDS